MAHAEPILQQQDFLDHVLDGLEDSPDRWIVANLYGVEKAVVQPGDNADPEAGLLHALRFVVGDFSQVSAVVSTQASQWYEFDTDQMVDVTSPDNILVSGKIPSGGVASVHIASNPFARSGYRMETYGREETLIASSGESPKHDRVPQLRPTPEAGGAGQRPTG